MKRKSKSIITIFCILYFLTLPACLAALAHPGSVHNSLLFANATGILVIVFSIIFSSMINNTSMSLLVISVVATLCTLPAIRISKSTSKSTDNSPHQQAFNYLKNGKNDIFFGWYPISHLLHTGRAYLQLKYQYISLKPCQKMFNFPQHIPRRNQNPRYWTFRNWTMDASTIHWSFN